MKIFKRLPQLWFTRWKRHSLRKVMFASPEALYPASEIAAEPLAQSNYLATAGYSIAALALARLAVEGRLLRLAMMLPTWSGGRQAKIHKVVQFLIENAVLDKAFKSRFDSFYYKASSRIHGKVYANDGRTQAILNRAERLCRELETLAPNCFQTADFMADLTVFSRPKKRPAPPVLVEC